MAMSNISSILRNIPVNVLLRRQSIARGVLLTKTVLYIIIIVVLAAMLREVFQSGFYSLVSSLEGKSDAPTVITTPPETEKTGKVDYSPIVTKAVFGPLGVPNAAPPKKAEKPVSQVALNLIGTFVDSGVAPYAIIEDDKKKTQDVFGISEMVFGQAKLVGVYADRVEIDRSGTIEILKLDDTETQGVQFKDGVATVGNDEFVVDEKELDKALENLPLLLTQARAVPYFEQGKAVGIRLFAIKTTSLFEKIGLQNGDVLRTINGNSLADLSEAMKLFERLKQERSISVTLTRNGAQKEFKYQIQ